MKKAIVLLFVILLANMVFAQEAVSLEINLPETYEEALAGENLWFTTKISGVPYGEQVELKYEMVDSKNGLKVSKFDFVKMGTHEAFTGNIKVPEGLEGTYLLKVSLGEAEDSVFVDLIKERTKTRDVIEKSLFDIVVDIPKSYRTLNPGDELLSSIKLINLGCSGRVDVFLDYWIVDSQENVVVKKTETVAVETQANFVRSFDLPENVSPGDYKLYAKITYADGKFADGEHSFVIEEKEMDIPKQTLYVVIILIVLGIMVLVLTRSKPLIEKMQVKIRVARIVKRKKQKSKN